MFFLYFAAVAIHLSYFAEAVKVIGPKSNIYVVNKGIAPDGFARQAILFGDSPNSASMPGPLIKATKGNKFSINVIDQLTDSSMDKTTSVHWHGLFQKGTAYADGSAFVTQCPITSGNSFKYEFDAKQAGTYWYHSHVGVQYCDGARGALIVYDPSDPFKHMYDIDNENTVITLSDWYHRQALELTPPFLQDATLINGKGRHTADPTAALAVISVQRGKRYRFRLISMSCDPSYKFSIDGHNMTIIETDGEPTKPITVNELTILTAQRYSFVLNANQPVNNYWVRAQPNVGVDTSFNKGLNSAILRYKGAPATDPKTSAQSNAVALVETNLHPHKDPKAPGKPFKGGADVVLTFELGFNAGQFLMNNITFTTPPLPVLLQILSGAQSAQDLLPEGSVFELPRNKVIEITFMGGNAPGGPHPFHLHGHVFSVVQSAGGSFNFKDPIRRDVTSVEPGQNTTIRFVTDNPGPWHLHCHIDFHLHQGLAVVLAEALKETRFVNKAPPAWDKLCPIYYALPEDER